MSLFKGISWTYLVSWVCSAFLYLVDSDLAGLKGIMVPSVLVSVSIFALFVLLPAVICLVSYRRGHWRGFFASVGGFALVMGVGLVLLGFGGDSVSSLFVGLLGAVGFFALVLVAASLPMVLSVGLEKKKVEGY